MEQNEKNRLNPSYQDMKEILHKVKSNSLHISRLPENTKDKFIALANDEFAGDYGMCIKFLVDGLVEPDFQLVYARLDELEREIQQLRVMTEQAPQVEEKESKIKLLNGKEL